VNAAVLLVRHRLPPFALLLSGGLCLTIAAAVWWGAGGLQRVVPWWIAFLVLTIVAERLEIIRFQRLSRIGAALGLLALGLLALGPAISLWDTAAGAFLLGAGLVLTAVWLVRRDIARRTVRTEGLPRFAATGVLAAYAWLVVAGALLVTGALTAGGVRYDAVIHAFFIGFVFSAIFAHGPIILPAVTGLPMRFTPFFYLPLVALEGGLIVRIAADLTGAHDVRRWAGMVQALAIMLFFGLSAARTAVGVRQAARAATASKPPEAEADGAFTSRG
jgi:hypothetical protein